jgi:nicotinamidase-related amidase
MIGLLIVDAQNGLFSSIANFDSKIEAMHTLLTKARMSGAPVFFTADVDVGEESSEARAIHSNLQPRSNEVIIEKGAADAFHATDLEAKLRAAHVETIVICGLKTPICVFATSMGALYRGFNVIFAADAHGSSDTEELAAERVVAYHNEFLDGFGSSAHGFAVSHANLQVLPVAQIRFGVLEP